LSLARDDILNNITIAWLTNTAISDARLSAATPDIWKTVDVALDVKGNSSASRELSFAHFSTIRTIDVNSVTYADGSTWHASSPGACSVAPSLIMRISAE
jgi:hypothetical protein